jgi:hypothetical protein
VVTLWGREWTREELLARVGRLEQIAGIRLVEGGDGTERGVRLPRHITWRQLGTVAYVVAMEPSTNRDAGRFDARRRGELTHLAPGEARRYRLEIGGLVGHDAIDAFARGAGDLAGQVEAPA